MKKIPLRAAMSVVLATSLGLGVPALASASSKTSVSATAKVPTAWTTWHATWVTYIDGIKVINTTFHDSLQSARATFSAAMSAATDKTQRAAARTALNAAVIAAMNIRVAAITAAGDPPAPPAGYNGSAFVDGIQAANIAYRAAVASAETSFTTAMSSATTTAQRTAARAALKAAVSAALVTRMTALSALGTGPSKPGQPLS